MSYRDDREELKQRVDELERELQTARQRADQAEGAQAKADRLAVELAGAQRNLERIQNELSKLQSPPKKSNAPVFAVGGMMILAGAAVALFAVRSPPQPPSIALPMTAIEPIAAPPPPPPIPPIPEPEPTPVPARAKTVRWTGKVLSSSGFALPAGTPCFAEASLKSSNQGSIDVDELLVQCADKKLYRLSDALEGISMTSRKVFEEPGPSAGTYTYSIIYQDQGQRSGKRAQVSMESIWGKANAWSEINPVYRVSIQLNSESEINKEPPLDPLHESTEVDFRNRLELKGTALAVNGQTTVQSGQPCAIKVFPTWGERGHNCRVSLRCGEQVLYGGGDSGYNRCEFKDGQLVSVKDEGASTADGDPMFSIDGTASTAVVQEGGGDGFEVKMKIEKPKRVAN